MVQEVSRPEWLEVCTVVDVHPAFINTDHSWENVSAITNFLPETTHLNNICGFSLSAPNNLPNKTPRDRLVDFEASKFQFQCMFALMISYHLVFAYK